MPFSSETLRLLRCFACSHDRTNCDKAEKDINFQVSCTPCAQDPNRRCGNDAAGIRGYVSNTLV